LRLKKAIFLAAWLATTAFAQDYQGLNLDFKSLIPTAGVGKLSEQSYCLKDQNGVHGYQVDKLQRIASVTKVISTYFASETLDLKKQYETKVYISEDRIHISGSLDPYFEEEKILILMKALNERGFKNFKSLTFDSKFKFYDISLQAHQEITEADTKARLQAYLNAKSSPLVKEKWSSISKFAAEEGVEIDKNSPPSLVVQSIELKESNPLANTTPQILIHRSRPLHHLLKAMNVMSKNYLAQNIFNEASQIKSFNQLILEAQINPETIRIYNGSGLPVKKGDTRKDNLASCRTVIKIVELLIRSLEKHDLDLSDVLAVNGGKDLGSFRERFLNYPETHEAVLSKTGTLMHASTLAGALLINEKTPFAILNQTTNIKNAKKFQDRFVVRMFDQLGHPTPMVYEKISIFPWQGDDFFTENY
jgi:D-alanyl-D-alanine carboxypeptidase/D-alanyl-D-alanine-endopeptidase (penicillin-binding protein 4)